MASAPAAGLALIVSQLPLAPIFIALACYGVHTAHEKGLPHPLTFNKMLIKLRQLNSAQQEYGLKVSLIAGGLAVLPYGWLWSTGVIAAVGGGIKLPV